MIKYKDKKIIRRTKSINDKFLNLLIYKNKVTQIKNPMSEFFMELKRNQKNGNFFEKNKTLTYYIMDTNFKFLT